MSSSRRIILGVDPGSRCTGYGIIWSKDSQIGHIAHGHIRCEQETLGERLQHIHRVLTEIIREHQPQEAAIEQVFTCHNHQAALKLGQARGAAISAMGQYSIVLAEYSARQVKKAVVGYGAATKTQIQHMMTRLLNLKTTIQADAADALAIALCHANTRQWQEKVGNL